MGNLAIYLKTQRVSKGFTQETLALKSGVSRVVIARIESDTMNERKFSIETFIKLANALDVPLEEFTSRE